MFLVLVPGLPLSFQAGDGTTNKQQTQTATQKRGGESRPIGRGGPRGAGGGSGIGEVFASRRHGRVGQGDGFGDLTKTEFVPDRAAAGDVGVAEATLQHRSHRRALGTRGWAGRPADPAPGTTGSFPTKGLGPIKVDATPQGRRDRANTVRLPGGSHVRLHPPLAVTEVIKVIFRGGTGRGHLGTSGVIAERPPLLPAAEWVEWHVELGLLRHAEGIPVNRPMLDPFCNRGVGGSGHDPAERGLVLLGRGRFPATIFAFATQRNVLKLMVTSGAIGYSLNLLPKFGEINKIKPGGLAGIRPQHALVHHNVVGTI